MPGEIGLKGERGDAGLNGEKGDRGIPGKLIFQKKIEQITNYAKLFAIIMMIT